MGRNTYNDVRASSNRVYAIGCRANLSGSTYLQLQSYNYAGTSPLTYTYNDTITNFQTTEGFKIPFASTFQVNITGIAKDSVGNKCNIILGVLSANLGLPYSVYNLGMPYNTKLNDAVTNQNSLYNLITGSKQVGSGQYMFLFGFSGSRFSININYKDSIINRSAGGNSIAFRDPYHACLVGYQDTRSNNFQPHDYQFFTRIYYDGGIGKVAKQTMETALQVNKNVPAQFSIFPNPAHHYINIESKEGIKDIMLSDISGKIVMRFHPQQAPGLYIVDISSLASGMYMLSINNGAAYKIVKQ